MGKSSCSLRYGVILGTQSAQTQGLLINRRSPHVPLDTVCTASICSINQAWRTALAEGGLLRHSQ